MEFQKAVKFEKGLIFISAKLSLLWLHRIITIKYWLILFRNQNWDFSLRFSGYLRIFPLLLKLYVHHVMYEKVKCPRAPFIKTFRAGSHFDIHVSISTSINISIRKIRKVCVNRDYVSISISTRNGTFFIFLCLYLCLCNPGSHIFFLFFLCLCLCLCLYEVWTSPYTLSEFVLLWKSEIIRFK